MKTLPLFAMEADFSVLEAGAATSLNWPFHPLWLSSKAEDFLVKISQGHLHHPFLISGRRGDLHESLASFYNKGRLLFSVLKAEAVTYLLAFSSSVVDQQS